MNRYLYLVLFMWMISSFMKAQNNDSIKYILPDDVEIKIDSYICKASLVDSTIALYLKSIGDDKFTIYVYEINRESDYLSKLTNRFIVINKNKYPLTLDYDSFFSTDSDIGEFGSRDGKILKTITIFEGYNVTFDIKGKRIKEDWGIYKRKSCK